MSNPTKYDIDRLVDVPSVRLLCGGAGDQIENLAGYRLLPEALHQFSEFTGFLLDVLDAPPPLCGSGSSSR
jgi:hypothetical protein